MKSSHLLTILLSSLFVFSQPLTAAVPEPQMQEEQLINFQYKVIVPAVKKGEGPVHVFLPLAQNDGHQTILKRSISSPLEGTIKKEEVYGNLFWHASVEHTENKEVAITVDYRIKRKLFDGFHPTGGVPLENQEDLQLFLQANRRVPVSGKLISSILADIPQTDSKPTSRAKAIYDYVVDNMEYKKVGTGWGNGDTHWACSKKYGNCTDFHALFISLARAQQIPSRFEIGFPIPQETAEGYIKGYHCWVTYYDKKFGWVPIDASEAKKHPEKRKMFFGTHPADRIQFTRGRDLELGQGHSSGPLNYFIYPHVEIDQKASPKVKTDFRYKILSS